MSPFSACTWAMAPRSRITLNTSYTCTQKRETLCEIPDTPSRHASMGEDIICCYSMSSSLMF
ncbi:hypothetical protein EYF80_068353 [Liparis tanakae]|uniref:Uncharacterized protein n=1 Tax=Liparis tanakae TaxID=230148 RepID=A0A4Z2DY87_9TELE|nr:hypothetical protein EYF80_068353 [Liparis tanakae]